MLLCQLEDYLEPKDGALGGENALYLTHLNDITESNEHLNRLSALGRLDVLLIKEADVSNSCFLFAKLLSKSTLLDKTLLWRA